MSKRVSAGNGQGGVVHAGEWLDVQPKVRKKNRLERRAARATQKKSARVDANKVDK